MGARTRTYSRMTTEALALLGHQIRFARKNRRMTESDLAERIGIARSTLQLIERGSPKVEIGLVFEAASLVGVPLFVSEPDALHLERSRLEDKLALLPHSIRQSPSDFNDEF